MIEISEKSEFYGWLHFEELHLKFLFQRYEKMNQNCPRNFLSKLEVEGARIPINVKSSVALFWKVTFEFFFLACQVGRVHQDQSKLS